MLKSRYPATLVAVFLALALLVLPRASAAGMDDDVRAFLNPPDSEAGDPDSPGGVRRVYLFGLSVQGRFEGGRLLLLAYPARQGTRPVAVNLAARRRAMVGIKTR